MGLTPDNDDMVSQIPEGVNYEQPSTSTVTSNRAQLFSTVKCLTSDNDNMVSQIPEDIDERYQEASHSTVTKGMDWRNSSSMSSLLESYKGRTEIMTKLFEKEMEENLKMEIQFQELHLMAIRFNRRLLKSDLTNFYYELIEAKDEKRESIKEEIEIIKKKIKEHENERMKILQKKRNLTKVLHMKETQRRRL